MKIEFIKCETLGAQATKVPLEQSNLETDTAHSKYEEIFPVLHHSDAILKMVASGKKISGGILHYQTISILI